MSNFGPRKGVLWKIRKTEWIRSDGERVFRAKLYLFNCFFKSVITVAYIKVGDLYVFSARFYPYLGSFNVKFF